MKIFLSALIFFLSANAQSIKPLVQAEISRLADTAHVEFRGLRNWRYDLQRDGNKKIILTVAPLDDASVQKLVSFTDPYLTSVKVDKDGPDGTHQVTFELADSNIESFDYLTDEPSRLIVDFYRKPPEDTKPTAATAAAPTPKVAPKRPAKKSASAAPTKASRQPAGDEFMNNPIPGEGPSRPPNLHFGIFDASDDNYDRFRIKDYEIRDEAIIASRQNVYLPFPMLRMRIPVLDNLLEQQPEFLIRPKDTGENKQARLLLTLFERGRFAVFIKTYHHFLKTYPESEYMEIVKNVAALVHLKRWLENKAPADFERAQALFSELVQKYPASPLREHNYLTLGFMQMEQGAALPTMQTLQAFVKTYPKSPEVPHVRMALSEVYSNLRKYPEATSELETIIKDYPRTEHAREAKYRLGDVLFAKGDLTQAITAYESALKDLPEDEKVYANAHFNMAEARFWQKDYKKSLNNYVQFVNLFPAHDYGGYALTRAGELLGIMGADQRRVMGAYLESYFRFPNHPGAKVARIRMLSQQMRSMKPNELKKALAEIESAAKASGLPGMEEFKTVMAAEGLTNRGEFKSALSNLIAYYQAHPTSANVGPIKSRILRNIASELGANVKANEFMKALSFHSQYEPTWLNNMDRIDIPYFVAGAYENAGAYDEAERIYSSALRQRLAIAGTAVEKEKKVNEHLPSTASLNLRLAAVMVQERKYIDAYQKIKAIGDGADLTPEENIERVRLSAMIAEQRGDSGKARDALLELAKRWTGEPSMLAPVHLQLAQTYLKLGDAKQAEAFANKTLGAESADSPIREDVIAGAFSVQGDARLAQKKQMAAVESYQKLLERFESRMPLASTRYKVGQILFDRGDFKGAAEVWQRLEGTPHEFLWKIGREKLADSEWKLDYEKYMSRIPAMAKEPKK